MSTPLLLLPGMMCDARLFDPQIAEISKHRQVEVPPLSGQNTMEGFAADILANAPDRFALGGLSMGGIVAMEIIRQAPHRVERLALIDTNPLAEREEIKVRRAKQIEKAQNGKLAEVLRDEMKPNYLAQGPRKENILDLCMDMALSLGPHVFVRQSVALRDRSDQQDTLRGYRQPTLILCGREDMLCPVNRHELMHALMPRSNLEIVEGAAHLPTLEQPETTTAALLRWLA